MPRVLQSTDTGAANLLTLYNLFETLCSSGSYCSLNKPLLGHNLLLISSSFQSVKLLTPGTKSVMLAKLAILSS